MNITNAIHNLRSIRNYSNKPIHLETIGEILDTARFSPSSGNLQNWRFIVVRDKTLRHDLAHASLSQEWMTKAPVHIVVCCDKNIVTKFYGSRGNILATQNCAIVSYSIMLKAKELGLGTCFVGMFDPETVSRILKIEGMEPHSIITLGYPEDPKLGYREPCRESLDKFIFFDKFGSKTLDTSLWPVVKFKNKIKSWFKR